MATLEQVEKLKQRANVSFEEARDALNSCNGDLLDALIMLERQGKTAAPNGGGYYSSEPEEIVPCEHAHKHGHKHKKDKYYRKEGDGWKNFSDFMGGAARFLLKIIEIGNRNTIEVWRKSEFLFAIPVSVFALLLIFMFWWVIPAMIFGLFFKFRYRFNGVELGKDLINNAMDNAADAAEATKETFRGSNWNRHENHEDENVRNAHSDKWDSGRAE